MRTYLPLAAALAATANVPAFAQAPTDPAFTGVHIEGLLGGDRSQANSHHDDGLLYGIGAGYDIAAGGVLVGGEIEANDSNAKTCAGTPTVATPALCAKAGRDLYVGGRVGTVVGGKALLYVKAGYTNGRYSLTSNDGTTTTRLDKKDYDGVRVGAGAEYALSTNTYLKAEYRYSNYEQGLSRNQLVGGFGVRF